MTEYFVLEYSYCLNISYWNILTDRMEILTDRMFCTGVSLLTEYCIPTDCVFVLKYP
jgi:hypothetical protein